MNTKTLMNTVREFRRQAVRGKSSRSHLLCRIRDKWEGWNPPMGDKRTHYINAVFEEIARVDTIGNLIQVNINYKQTNHNK